MKINIPRRKLRVTQNAIQSVIGNCTGNCIGNIKQNNGTSDLQQNFLKQPLPSFLQVTKGNGFLILFTEHERPKS